MTRWGLVTRGDLREVAVRLRAVDDTKEIRRLFRKELRAAAQPLVPVVRQAALAIPAKGPDHTGLRQRLARATTLRVRTTGKYPTVAILVDPKRMPDGEKNLQNYMEGLERWRHPVFGHDPWKTQTPHPYFFNALRPLGTRARLAVNKVVRQVTWDIAGKP